MPNQRRRVKGQKDMDTTPHHDITPPRGALVFCTLDRTAAERKLVAILSRLASPFDGERLAAAQLANELINRLGLQWADVVHINGITESRPSPPAWREMLRACAQRFQYLSESEQSFIATIAQYAHRPTPRQLEWLAVIYQRISEGEQ